MARVCEVRKIAKGMTLKAGESVIGFDGDSYLVVRKKRTKGKDSYERILRTWDGAGKLKLGNDESVLYYADGIALVRQNRKIPRDSSADAEDEDEDA